MKSASCVSPRTLESRESGAEGTAVNRQRLVKHITAATNTHATVDVVLSMWSVFISNTRYIVKGKYTTSSSQNVFCHFLGNEMAVVP
jgi:hypothetical protein